MYSFLSFSSQLPPVQTVKHVGIIPSGGSIDVVMSKLCEGKILGLNLLESMY